MNDLMAELTRLLLAFMAGMLTGPLFYVIHIRRRNLLLNQG
jgi:hypothetical protein